MLKRLARGALIVFEGIDGAGKTTQAHRLVNALEDAGWDALYTKEPTDGPWGQKIRASVTGERMSLEDELHAFLEDRKDHVRDELGPALTAGTLIVLDRYYFSTAAYQGPRGADPKEILETNERFAPRPDLLVFLDIPVETAMERIEKRGLGKNSFERADALEQSRAIFRGIDAPYLLALDGRRTIEDLGGEILRVVRERLLTA